jgi:hypothetical protein
MKYINEYNAEYIPAQGLEGVSAKDVLLNIYPQTLEAVIKDFDKQCDEGVEFKNKNLDMLRSIIGFTVKYHPHSKYIKAMAAKYNLK